MNLKNDGNQFDNQSNQYNSQFNNPGNQYNAQFNSQYGNQYNNTNYNQYANQYNTQYNNQYNAQYTANTMKAMNQGSSKTSKRYAEMAYAKPGQTEVSANKYNLIIGGCLFWGFIVNCIMCSALSDSILNLVRGGGMIGFFILYFALVICGSLMVNKSDNPVVSFIGYNLIVVPLGMCISIILSAYVAEGYSNIIAVAFGITAFVTLIMMVLGSLFPEFFLSIGKTLFICLLITIVAEIVLALMHIDLGIIDYIVVTIFSGYIGYDWARANTCAKTVDNAVDNAAYLYVDIANLFIRLLSILGRRN